MAATETTRLLTPSINAEGYGADDDGVAARPHDSFVNSTKAADGDDGDGSSSKSSSSGGGRRGGGAEEEKGATTSAAASAPPLRFATVVWFSLPYFAFNMMLTMMNSWLTTFYLPPTSDDANLVGYMGFSGAALFGRLASAFWGVQVGYLSDRSTLSLGRRKPFLYFITPLYAALFVLLFFPPDATATTGNLVFLMFIYIAWSMCLPSVMLPYHALFAEISQVPKTRLQLSSVGGVWSILGHLAAAAIGPFVFFFDSAYPEGLQLGALYFSSGLQICAVVVGLTVLTFIVPAIVVSEQPNSERKDNGNAKLWTETLATMKNPAFRTLCLSINVFGPMGNLFMTANLPYLFVAVFETEGGIIEIGQGNWWLGVSLAITVLGALMGVPIAARLAKKFGKKRVMLGTSVFVALANLAVFFSVMLPDPAVLGFCAIVLISLPSAGFFTLPNAMYADVVDHDEKLTGMRREGVYAGAQQFFNKIGLGIAQLVFVWLLELGKTPENPTGVVYCALAASILFALSFVALLWHPIET